MGHSKAKSVYSLHEKSQDITKQKQINEDFYIANLTTENKLFEEIKIKEKLEQCG